MKISDMVTLIKSSEKTRKFNNEENSYNFLLEKFGENFKNRCTNEIQYNNFVKGHRNVIFLDENTVKNFNIDLNKYEYIKKSNSFCIFKNSVMKDKYIKITNANDPNTEDKSKGELFSYPPASINYYNSRNVNFTTPGVYEDLTVHVSWGDSSFVTNVNNLEDDLIWLNKNRGSMDGKCYIYKERTKYEVYKKDGNNNDWFFKEGQIYCTTFFEETYEDTVAVIIKDIII